MQEDVKSISLHEAVDRVFLKLGRNVVSYQYFETSLREFVIDTLGIFSPKSISGDKKHVINTAGLHDILMLFLNLVHVKLAREYKPKGDKLELLNAICADFPSSTQEQLQRYKRLNDLNEARNLSIHSLDKEYCLKTLEGCCELEIFFDDQLNKLLRETGVLERSNRLLKRYNQQNILGGQMSFDGVYSVLKSVADAYKDEHGWTDLCTLGGVMHQECNRNNLSMYKLFGYKKVSSIVKATQLFEVKILINDELQSGVYYRLLSNKN